MSFKLLRSSRFSRHLKKILKRNPEFQQPILETLQLLIKDPYCSSLKTHKLKGELNHLLACSVAYDIRILFEFVDHEGEQAIFLETIGNHDEVY